MGKIGLTSAKYIVHANLFIEGVVDKPDVIGAIFGQTEGLLGSDLELRELQRSGRIGRIEVTTDVKGGKTSGEIIIPSSLDKAETAIIAAALEIIERIGPCNAKIKITNIEDVRFTKRQYVVDRAKQLLKEMIEKQIPDSQEISEEVAHSVRMMEIKEYGKERLPAGPLVDESDEIIVVEGRADVLNLLKHGIKNVISMNGTSVPTTIVNLSKKKIITAFVDGDRGGDLILKELIGIAEVDYVTKAPDGKEVEEITKKEIHKALRNKMSVEQAKLELGLNNIRKEEEIKRIRREPRRENRFVHHLPQQSYNRARKKPLKLENNEKKKIKAMLEDLIGTRGAYLLDDHDVILGKVPILELSSVLKETKGVNTIIMDGTIDSNLMNILVNNGIRRVVSMSSRVQDTREKIEIYTYKDL